MKKNKISTYVPSIFQGRIDFAGVSQAPRRSLAIEHPFERHLLTILILALAALACGYLYFVTASVLNVMSRREAISEIAKIQGSIGNLEQEYFALSHDVNLSSASSLGLAPLSKTSYVYRPGNVGAATIAAHEI